MDPELLQCLCILGDIEGADSAEDCDDANVDMWFKS